ncbi:MAG: hypothetical protein WD468_12745 [Pirellulales bacterium]
MVLRGRIQSGVVVLEESCTLPEGTAVTVVAAEPSSAMPQEESFFRITDLAVPAGVPDLSVNLDYYLYGHPKQTDDA